MNWFFAEDVGNVGDTYVLTGEDALHITKSLRMSVGEVITLCDKQKKEHLCRIEKIDRNGVYTKIISKEECDHEPTVALTIYFALTKGDKPETVIQKCIELGAAGFVPVLTERCISRPDEKSSSKKTERYQKIAAQAAMQSRRGIIPAVRPLAALKDIGAELKEYDKAIVFYEGGGSPLRELIKPEDKSIAVFIGPEGGLEESEVDFLKSCGAEAATLGKRILRAETAPIAAAAAIMFHTGNLE